MYLKAPLLIRSGAFLINTHSAVYQSTKLESEFGYKRRMIEKLLCLYCTACFRMKNEMTTATAIIPAQI